MVRGYRERPRNTSQQVVEKVRQRMTCGSLARAAGRYAARRSWLAFARRSRINCSTRSAGKGWLKK